MSFDERQRWIDELTAQQHEELSSTNRARPSLRSSASSSASQPPPSHSIPAFGQPRSTSSGLTYGNANITASQLVGPSSVLRAGKHS